MQNLLTKSYTPTRKHIDQTAIEVTRRLREQSTIEVRNSNSCDYCGRLAKRVKGVAVCPTCAGGW